MHDDGTTHFLLASQPSSELKSNLEGLMKGVGRRLSLESRHSMASLSSFALVKQRRERARSSRCRLTTISESDLVVGSANTADEELQQDTVHLRTMCWLVNSLARIVRRGMGGQSMKLELDVKA